MTRAPLFSLISLTCDPPFPMIIEASWVTIKQRMWMLAAGAAEDDADALGAAEVVAEEPSAAASPDGGASPLTAVALSVEGDGVDAAVSSTAGGPSIRASSRPAADAEVLEALVCASFDVAPVLALFCLGWSASEGERDRFRVVSASGMVVISVFHNPVRLRPVSRVHRMGGSGRRFVVVGVGFWIGGVWAVRWGMREGGGTAPPFLRLTW